MKVLIFVTIFLAVLKIKDLFMRLYVLVKFNNLYEGEKQELLNSEELDLPGGAREAMVSLMETLVVHDYNGLTAEAVVRAHDFLITYLKTFNGNGAIGDDENDIKRFNIEVESIISMIESGGSPYEALMQVR